MTGDCWVSTIDRFLSTAIEKIYRMPGTQDVDMGVLTHLGPIAPLANSLAH